jgi:hypothetical protein
MRALFVLLASLLVVSAAYASDAVAGRVIKVLPFLLDQQGRVARSPSLFDRDAYQAYLRDNPKQVSAMRFDILWSADKAPDENLKIVVELRGIGAGSVPKLLTLETNAVPGRYRQWTDVPLAGQAYTDFGRMVAWRVRLKNGDAILGEQKSFLW